MNRLLAVIEANGIEKLLLEEDYSYGYLRFYFKEKWFLSLSMSYQFTDNTKVKALCDNKYEIINIENEEIINIYIFIDHSGLYEYCLYEKQNIYFGTNNESNLIPNHSYLNNKDFRIVDGYLSTSLDNLYLNNRICHKDCKLKDNDKIEYLGLTIYYYQDFIYMNNFLKENKLKKYTEKGQCIAYNNYPKVFKPNFIYEEVNTLNIKEMKSFSFEYKENKISFMTMLPGIMMSFSMMTVSLFNIYNNVDNLSLSKVIPLLIMPLTMIITTLFIPIINAFIEKQKRKKAYKKQLKEYLVYLEDYLDTLRKNIDDFVYKEKNYFLDIKSLKDKNFFLNNNSAYFATLSIGYTKIKHALSFPKNKEATIEKSYKKIKEQLNESVPLFIHPLNYQALTIYTSEADVKYRLKLIVLELCLKNNFNQLKLAIYSNEVEKDYMSYLPHLFIDGYRLLFDSISELIKLDELVTVSTIVIILKNIDYKFKNKNIHVIYLTSDSSSIYLGSDILISYKHSSGTIIGKDNYQFSYYDYAIDFNQLFYYLSSFNSNNNANSLSSFRDYYPNLDILKNYQNKQIGLIGGFAYKDDKLYSLDLHENKSGPHGLIGGTTGSGKSELIVSLLLSLCMRYSPRYLNIIIVDYKGGGIIDSLSYKGMMLPHMVASIDNNEQASFERLIIAISYELKKRQKLFNELSKLSYSSITNIDEYLANNPTNYNLELLPHLLIVVDEFAELKKNQSNLIKELVSFSRIGRSLGLHIILATQKPSNSVDDEIWSNSRFKIALKVADEKDSNEIIKNHDAAYIKKPGEFYILVDGVIEKACALYSKKDYFDNDDYEIHLLDLNLNSFQKFSFKGQKSLSEANYYLERINEATTYLGIDVKSWDFKKPESKTNIELVKQYSYKGNDIVLGEIDDYINNKRGILTVSKDDNAFIISSRNKEINNIINSYKNELIIVVSDKQYQNVPDSYKYDDESDLHFLFQKLLKSNEKVTLIIEDLACLLSYSDDYLEYIYLLNKRASSLKVNVIAISKSSQINYKLLNSFNHRYCINVLDHSDITTIMNSISKYEGNSFFYYEQAIPFVPSIIEETIIHKNTKKYIESIPKVISKEKDRLLVGYDILKRAKVYLKANEILYVFASDKKLIEKHKSFYQDEKTVFLLYDSSLLKNTYSTILWLSNDIQNQRLFYVPNNIHISEDEGYFFENGSGKIVKLVNNA